MNAIYGIGCYYSRHPSLFQAPFFTPHKANQFFINKSVMSFPPPHSKDFQSFANLEIAQAGMLLTSWDLSVTTSRTWMMCGISHRLISRFNMAQAENTPDFIALNTANAVQNLSCTPKERKRLLFSFLLTDLYLAISGSASMVINEADYVNAINDVASFPNRSSPKITGVLNEFLTGSTFNRVPQNDSADMDRWKPFFSGIPKDNLFAGTESTNERWTVEKPRDFFQVSHLFSSLDEVCHLVQLSFITRRVIRFVKKMESSTPNDAVNVLHNLFSPKSDNESGEIHDALINFYHLLPAEYRLWASFEFLTGDCDPSSHCSVRKGSRMSALSVNINLLFFYSLALLHQVQNKLTLEIGRPQCSFFQ